MTTTRLVRTKSGSRVHLAGTGSVQTYCGIRHSGTVVAKASSVVCGSCGIPPEMTGLSLNERFGPATAEPAETCPKCHRATTADQQHGIVRHADESGDCKVHDGGCDHCYECTRAS